MKRYDLRHLHDDFYDRMGELIDEGLKVGEVGIFLFEVGDFSHIQKSADYIKALGHDLMNSLKFNEVDWTIVVKKVDEQTQKARAEAVEKARIEAEQKAVEEAKAAEEKAKADAVAAEAKAKEKAEAKAKAEAETKAKEEAKKAATAKNESVSKGADKKEPAKETAGKKEKAPQGDDLTKIKGVGKAYMEKLNSEGIYTVKDVANMTKEQIQMMEEKYSFKGDFKESVADAKKILKSKAK
ncbi:Putative TolA protein [hydrothermal vent metagenome]|uniref:Putative TolA protein n=1 Tax=hydrothermal vent metagenome TaxID=652676 RepID=A0A1W1EAQ5_9ZZZZ